MSDLNPHSSFLTQNYDGYNPLDQSLRSQHKPLSAVTSDFDKKYGQYNTYQPPQQTQQYQQ